MCGHASGEIITMKPIATLSRIGWCLMVATMLLVTSCGGGGGNNTSASSTAANVTANSTLPANTFVATLTGAQAVPPNASAALATGSVVVDPGTRLLKAAVVTDGITGTSVAIRQGPRGTAGPVILSLAETSPGSGIWTGQATLSEAQLAALTLENFYFEVQSAAFPSGEIHGQIAPQLPASAGSGLVAPGTPSIAAFISVLTGSQNIAPTSSTATGIATAIVDSSTKTLATTVILLGATATAAEIRNAGPGSNGPVVFLLAQNPPNSGIWTLKSPLSNAQLASILAGQYYFEVRSAAFPNGELRAPIALLASVQNGAANAAVATVPAGVATTPFATPAASIQPSTGFPASTIQTPSNTGTTTTTAITGTGATTTGISTPTGTMGSGTTGATGTGTTGIVGATGF
jgi:hypothetical protein